MLRSARRSRAAGITVLATLLTSVFLQAPSAHATPGKSSESIAWTTDRNGRFTNYDLYKMRVGSSQQTQLTTDPNVDLEAAWYPDGTRMAFVTDRESPGFLDTEIYTMNADGSNQTKLFNDPSCYDFDPAYSPDGTRLAYSRQCDGITGDSVLYVKSATGTDIGTALAGTEITPYDELPTWSPDGSQIAYDGGDGPFATDDQDIYVISSTGGVAHDITDIHPNHEIAADWNPKTNEILFYSGLDYVIDDEIYKVNSDGTGLVQLTNNTWGDFDPAWSPSGGRIAFSATPDPSQEDIYVMNQNGNAIIQLTNDPSDDLDPDWQPRAEAGVA
jgi:TolB protein